MPGYQNEVCQYLQNNPRTIVILDDDPTGTQTVQNIPVVTDWSENTLERELLQSPVFFVLTNSRAMRGHEATDLAVIIGGRLKDLALKHGKKLVVISRGDSTLRGHYPNEVVALAKALGDKKGKHVLIPAFFEGGRYTCNDVHYVREGDTFIPAADTPFAQDGTFGYDHSNLLEYVAEKYKGRLPHGKVTSISIDTLRTGQIANQLNDLMAQYHCIVVNGTSHADLEAFALAALQSNRPLVYRTAASFVNAIIGKRPAPLLNKKDFQNNKETGALIVIGSYVPKTTAQLNILKKKYHAEYIAINVDAIFSDTHVQQTLVKIAARLNEFLDDRKSVVLYTSRKLKKGRDDEESLEIVNKVSQALTSLVGMITVQPRFVLAKGGITSSDIAVKSLCIQRANVLGQLIHGVPVWQADEHSKFPAMPYIVFPGNVGSNEDLYNALNKLR